MRKASALLDLAPSVAKAPLADALRVKKQGVCREEVGGRGRKLEENRSPAELHAFRLPRWKEETEGKK